MHDAPRDTLRDESPDGHVADRQSLQAGDRTLTAFAPPAPRARVLVTLVAWASMAWFGVPWGVFALVCFFLCVVLVAYSLLDRAWSAIDRRRGCRAS